MTDTMVRYGLEVSDDDRATFARDGFVVLRGVVPTYLRCDLQDAMAACYGIQARKIAALRPLLGTGATPEALERTVTLLEEHDQEAGYQALSLVGRSQGGRRWAAWDGWGALAEELLSVQPSFAFVLASSFVNLPGSERLLYRWHCEAHYYPKRRRFLNCWTPLFRAKHAGNGTMALARGSHLLADLPFAEYQSGPRHFRQYEIPESAVAGCERVDIAAEPGDLVVFHPRTVHSSSPNRSREPSFAAVTRVFDVRDDLTLSGDMAATPYGGDYGRAGMDVA